MHDFLMPIDTCIVDTMSTLMIACHVLMQQIAEETVACNRELIESLCNMELQRDLSLLQETMYWGFYSIIIVP